MFVLHEQESTCGLLRHSYSYIYTGMLKAKATTDTFFMISRVILSINDRHISPGNSFLVNPVSTKSIWGNRPSFPLHSHIWCKAICAGKAQIARSSQTGKIWPPVSSHHLHGSKVGQLNRRLTNDVCLLFLNWNTTKEVIQNFKRHPFLTVSSCKN